MIRIFRHLFALPFRFLPGAIRYRLIQIILTAEGKRPPKDALRALFKIDDHLTWCINNATVEYANGIHVKHRLMKYHDFFVDRILPNEKVMDLGCGYGAVAHSVASRTGAQVTGIDLNPKNIAQAKANYKLANLTFIEGDVFKDLPNETFDTIVFSNVLEHIEHRVDFLTTVQEQLTPKRWLIRVPMFNRDWRVPLRQELGITYFSDGTHFTEYTRESFEQEMQEAQLTITHIQINWGEIWAEVKNNA
jgi:2-polyprenyl-3-methyl-5-hydroxy-6-metoxy-1,4-benzoquinol methylase